MQGPTSSIPRDGVARSDRRLHWLRVRLDSGRYQAGHWPMLSAMRFNTVEAVSLRTVADEVVGQSDGRTFQRFALRHRPVVRSAVTVEVGEPPEEWTVVRDLMQSGPQDEHVTVDERRGSIGFGDGTHGSVPVAGSDIVVSYRYGGTALANVGAESISGIQATIIGLKSVSNLRPAAGGCDEESVEQLKRNAGARLNSRERAVTADDYRLLALGVGGVADAVALPMHHPEHPDVEYPGAVTVVVLADGPFADGPPDAKPELLEAVDAALRSCRVIGTELFVGKARFRRLGVDAVVDVDPYGPVGTIIGNVERAVRQSLAPPSRVAAARGSTRAAFGQPYTPTALYRVIQSVADVRGVTDLQVTIDDAPVESLTEPIRLAPDELLVAGPSVLVRLSPESAR